MWELCLASAVCFGVVVTGYCISDIYLTTGAVAQFPYFSGVRQMEPVIKIPCPSPATKSRFATRNPELFSILSINCRSSDI
jgi:hypothetical protein